MYHGQCTNFCRSVTIERLPHYMRIPILEPNQVVLYMCTSGSPTTARSFSLWLPVGEKAQLTNILSYFPECCNRTLNVAIVL
jgi:hypothetical protein